MKFWLKMDFSKVTPMEKASSLGVLVCSVFDNHLSSVGSWDTEEDNLKLPPWSMSFPVSCRRAVWWQVDVGGRSGSNIANSETVGNLSSFSNQALSSSALKWVQL